MPTPATIDAYMVAATAEVQPVLQAIRATIRQAAPLAQERISYRMPAFFQGKKALVYFGAFKQHIGLYPVDQLVTVEVEPAALAGLWRMSEGTPQTLSLGGVWPGALVAQQVLRHQSNKAAFRSVFWATVVVNVAGFVFIHSPWGAGWRV